MAFGLYGKVQDSNSRVTDIYYREAVSWPAGFTETALSAFPTTEGPYILSGSTAIYDATLDTADQATNAAALRTVLQLGTASTHSTSDYDAAGAAAAAQAASQPVDSDLTQLAGLNATGFARQAGAGSWSIVAETGTGSVARATSPTLVTPILGTPTSGNLANCTGYVGTAALIIVGALGAGSITTGFTVDAALVTWNGAIPASAMAAPVVTTLGATLALTGVWTEFDVVIDFTDVKTAATTKNVTTLVIPTKGLVDLASVYHTQFTGTGLTAITATLQNASGPTSLTSARNVFAAANDPRTYTTSILQGNQLSTATWQVAFSATFTGGHTLNDLTAGTVTVSCRGALTS